MGVGHSRVFFVICSPCIFENSSIFGHSRGFLKNCSPGPVRAWVQTTLFEEMFSFLMEKHGEQINVNCHLCPISIKYTENYGEQILYISHCAQTREIYGEHFNKMSSCAQTTTAVMGKSSHHPGNRPPRLSRTARHRQSSPSRLSRPARRRQNSPSPRQQDGRWAVHTKLTCVKFLHTLI